MSAAKFRKRHGYHRAILIFASSEGLPGILCKESDLMLYTYCLIYFRNRFFLTLL